MSAAPSQGGRLAILLSGQGSTYEAIQQACDTGQCAARPILVLSNRRRANGLTIAEQYGIDHQAFPARAFADRDAQEAAMAAAVDVAEADWVILAGYMRILGAGFVRRYHGRMINTHPSLLPAYRGLDTYQRALDAGERVHGCSVHFVTKDLDGGPVIARAEVPVRADDTAATLEERTRQRERRLYPLVIDRLARGRISLSGDRVMLNGKALREPLTLPYDGEELV